MWLERPFKSISNLMQSQRWYGTETATKKSFTLTWIAEALQQTNRSLSYSKNEKSELPQLDIENSIISFFESRKQIEKWIKYSSSFRWSLWSRWDFPFNSIFHAECLRSSWNQFFAKSLLSSLGIKIDSITAFEVVKINTWHFLRFHTFNFAILQAIECATMATWLMSWTHAYFIFIHDCIAHQPQQKKKTHTPRHSDTKSGNSYYKLAVNWVEWNHN